MSTAPRTRTATPPRRCRVDAAAIVDDDALTSWLDIALDHDRATADRP